MDELVTLFQNVKAGEHVHLERIPNTTNEK